MELVSFVFADRHIVPGFLGKDVQKEVCDHVKELRPDKVLLVTEEHVDELYGSYFKLLESAVGETGDAAKSSASLCVEKMVLPSGDAAKSWEHLTRLVEWNFRVEATSKSVVLAFGGGALLNVAGLFASLAYRGLRLVYVPTTFLAMHDVVTSLKTSICFDGRKNNIGSFYAPLKVLIDVSFCSSLPRQELFSGLGELARNAALLGGEHAEAFVRALSKESIDCMNGGSGEEFSLSDDALLELVRSGVEAKMSVLGVDAYERTTGMVFEYGHTVAHALELAYGEGALPHGIAVCYGMLASSLAARELGLMTEEARGEHDALCRLVVDRWPLPEPRPSVERVVALALRDSRRGLASEAPGELADVLVHEVGRVVATRTNNLSKFPCRLVAQWLELQGFPREAAQEPRPEAALAPRALDREVQAGSGEMPEAC